MATTPPPFTDELILPLSPIEEEEEEVPPTAEEVSPKPEKTRFSLRYLGKEMPYYGRQKRGMETKSPPGRKRGRGGKVMVGMEENAEKTGPRRGRSSREKLATEELVENGHQTTSKRGHIAKETQEPEEHTESGHKLNFEQTGPKRGRIAKEAQGPEEQLESGHKLNSEQEEGQKYLQAETTAGSTKAMKTKVAVSGPKRCRPCKSKKPLSSDKRLKDEIEHLNTERDKLERELGESRLHASSQAELNFSLRGELSRLMEQSRNEIARLMEHFRNEIASKNQELETSSSKQIRLEKKLEEAKAHVLRADERVRKRDSHIKSLREAMMMSEKNADGDIKRARQAGYNEGYIDGGKISRKDFVDLHQLEPSQANSKPMQSLAASIAGSSI